MAKVRVLDEFTINQIAAGEIIENPASIVKELVENSMDADSSAITVEIKDGGTSFIRVTDNGIGMNFDDAETALQRHATSKITNAEDLDLIYTLGFRGEALASIAAVTQFEMFTRAKDHLSGTHIVNHGGEFIDITETGCPEGTTIIVRNLFFNTPARLKFLKSTRAESAKISDIMSKLIMGNPDISIKYINNDRIIYHSPGNGRLLSTIMSIYGADISKDLIKLEHKSSESKIIIHGFLGKPSIARKNRAHQSFFVNNRYIENSIPLTRALEDAYKNYTTTKSYPLIVLHISIPTDQIDVNIHPAKTEIRFKDERYIYDMIHYTISKSLGGDSYIPEIRAKAQTVEEDNPVILSTTVDDKPPISIRPVMDLNPDRVKSPSKEASHKRTKPAKPDGGDKGMESQLSVYDMDGQIPYRIIGTFLKTYIMVEQGEILYIIDQHAAHERILYEKFKQRRLDSDIAVQMMSPPLTIDVTYNERISLEASTEAFAKLGFEIDHFGGNTFIIRGVPAILGKLNVKELFFDILGGLDEDTSRRPYIIDEDYIITCACKRAIKAHDALSDREIDALFRELGDSDIKQFTCPHGRPIMIKFTRYELEKYFKRVI
ncbi:MAG: DNA mismatch repair endonuclease MutL [Clostridiales bacterium]|nr:DNA mismatch repair endonuclease MutL [Clostridiales bacterium]